MEWFALLLAVAALGVAADSEAKAARLAKRLAALEELVAKHKAADDAEAPR